MCLGISDDVSSFQQLLDLLQVVFADDVRGNDEFPLGMVAEIADEDFLVGRP